MPTYLDSPSGFANLQTPFLASNVVTYPYPWPNNGTVAQYDLEFIVDANWYSPAAYGSTSGFAPSAYLVEQGPVTKIAPGFVRYRRVYSQVPNAWTEKQQVAYTFPGRSGINPNGNWEPYFWRASVTLFAVASVEHTYTQGTSAPDPDATFLVTDDGNVVDYIGLSNPNFGSTFTDPSSEPAEYNVSSEVRLLRPTIWEKVSSQVPKPV